MEEAIETGMQESSPSISPEQLNEIKGLLLGPGKELPNLGDGISSVLSNPELMARLPQMMEMLKPMLAKALPTAPSEPKPLSREEERDRLLLSLRPFLSKERQDLVEAILKLSKLGEVLKHLS